MLLSYNIKKFNSGMTVSSRPDAVMHYETKAVTT